jgi:hypothetical protein
MSTPIRPPLKDMTFSELLAWIVSWPVRIIKAVITAIIWISVIAVILFVIAYKFDLLPKAPPPEPSIEEIVQAFFSDHKQDLFNSIHPIGNAVGVKVLDVTVTQWKGGHPNSEIEDVREMEVRYVLYWSSPLHSDGFTKAKIKYDGDVDRFLTPEILETNGTTWVDVGDALKPLVPIIVQSVVDHAVDKAMNGDNQPTNDDDRPTNGN